jgi:hypothetical protein
MTLKYTIILQLIKLVILVYLLQEAPGNVFFFW